MTQPSLAVQEFIKADINNHKMVIRLYSTGALVLAGLTTTIKSGCLSRMSHHITTFIVKYTLHSRSMESSSKIYNYKRTTVAFPTSAYHKRRKMYQAQLGQRL
ncbi:hypothetical protein L211DRAFT_850548 [Terfezia boudieri ATCC MYA-4762]|uniref:Uncharacterized protein n=1 Tax=Terfezia boudieri ATCC MYA-4762 TaxID=1051890 RepID=A0A3N4LWU0_9PEZI|nr:hypothetical protein L211DRAFT_850548 [Terfezia boudieri ATCC MYA-4762]